MPSTGSAPSAISFTPLSTKDELRYAVELTESRIVLTFELNEEHCSDLGVEVIRCKTPAYFPAGIKGRIMKTVYNHTVRHAKQTTGRSCEWSTLLDEGREFLKTASVHRGRTLRMRILPSSSTRR